MPPKRKNKITKAAPAMPLKRQPRNKISETAKLGQVRRNSLAATSGRTSRLLPSVPFQMTTRRSAKTASAGPSSASSGSRRNSLDDIAQFQDALSEHEDERPAKRSRTSTDSGSPQMSNASFDHNAPMNGTKTPELQKPTSGATVTAPKTAGRKRRASDDSTQSGKTLSARPNGVPSRTQSNVSEHQQPRRKKRKTAEAPVDSVENPPELTDASTAPNSPEQIPEVDGSQSLQNVLPTNGDAPVKTGRRLPGRRRQPHPDINIEVDLRRQLTLKMNYRSLAKVQKTLLEELSRRTINSLENDPNYHKQCPEYKPLMAALDERRDGRIDQLDAARKYRHEQLERVHVGEEHIQKEQYINRFQELQDDFLLQCYVRMKRIEREMKGVQDDATDDEDNILPPTHAEEAAHGIDDRIAPKYASRSWAYIEADRELEDDARRKRFSCARATFVEKDEDADDSIEEVTGGFATFSGPDRDEAIAHHNLTSIVDAANEVERTPSPKSEPLEARVIPNAQAFDLMILADLSAQQARSTQSQGMQQQVQRQQQQDQLQVQQQPPQDHSYQDAAPNVEGEVKENMPPMYAPEHGDFDTPKEDFTMPSPVAQSNPPGNSPRPIPKPQETPQSVPNGLDADKAATASTDLTPARVTTHRIMDILNNDREVPFHRSRDSQPSTQEPNTPLIREATKIQHNTPSQNAKPHAQVTVNPEAPVDQALMDALGGKPSDPPASPPRSTQAWSRPNIAPSKESEDSLRRRDPLQKIRELLDRKARELGREPPDRSKYRSTPLFFPTLSLLQDSQKPQDVAGYDPARPSAGLYSASSALGSANPVGARAEPPEHSSSHWEREHERERRMSASQAPQQQPQSPYQAYQSQPHPDQHTQEHRQHSRHNSYAPPPGSLPLPPKPPGPPPPNHAPLSHPPPVNFRFAHYDPAPPRHTYPPTSPTYPAGSYAPQMGPPPQYAPTYAPPYQSSYIPPPGSFQAPPPLLQNIAPYPPLKFHQYGGQPILPASMAPSPQAGPTRTYLRQPSTTVAGPSQPPRPQYEPQREGQPGDRQPEPQSRPRRQYRSYHAPGTQFRSYQGPAEGRRRGG